MKALNLHIAATLALGAVLTGCVPQAAPPTPAPPPAPRPAPAPAPAPAPPPPPAPRYDNWIDAPQTPGTWRYESGAAGRTQAVFVAPNNAPLLRLRCEADRAMVILSLPETGAAQPAITIRTQTATRTLAASPAGRETLAAFEPRDPLLDAMVFARGRFAVEASGLPALYLPSWPAIARVIEDCR